MGTAVDGVEYTPGELDRDATFYVAGHRGLVGSAIRRKLEASGFENIVGKTSAELDLKDRDAVFAYLGEIRPKYVVLAAAKVGGILANSTYPVDFLSDNMRIQVNVLDAALSNDVERVLFLGSSCIYPKFAPQPMPESCLLTGELEPTNEDWQYTYAVALENMGRADEAIGHLHSVLQNENNQPRLRQLLQLYRQKYGMNYGM